MRYDYPLTPESVVVECGAYKGAFARAISDKFHCRVISFEPCKAWFSDAVAQSRNYPSLTLFNLAVGYASRLDTLKIKGDMTGFFEVGEFEPVQVVKLADVLATLRLTTPIDLLAINIEGGEFEVLEGLLDDGVVSQFLNIQVQFHSVVPNAQNRHDVIMNRLLKTHELTYYAPFCWENYRLK